MDHLHQEINDRITLSDFKRAVITPYTVRTCINKLKPGKSDGKDNFYSDHLINSGDRLFVLLSIVFNSMIVHGYTPDDLLCSSIISIPKDIKLSASNSDNYRGISLFNSICKVYDMLIIDICHQQLKTSDMQFGFKSKHSTIMCTAVYLEIISYYLNRNSNVYSCLLDASKAFDRVNYGKLFRILIDRNLPFCIIRCIKDSYIRQQVTVIWDNYHSLPFNISNGVKQGGVLSPILFTVYIDDLLKKLRNSGIGCCMNNVYTGVVAYADDITLLSPSVRGLNSMLVICSEYAVDNNIIFNASKTMCIKYGETVKDCEKVICNNVNISWCINIKHLGTYIDSSLTDKFDCNRKNSAFVGSINKLLSNFYMVQPEILCNLFKLYCCSLYGAQLWYFNSAGFEKCCFYWNKAIRKIFKLPYQTHRWMLGPLSNQLHIIRTIIFAYFKSDKFYVHMSKFDCKYMYQ
jgi:hypothetical protein